MKHLNRSSRLFFFLLSLLLYLNPAWASEAEDGATFAASQVFEAVKRADAKGVVYWLPPDLKRELGGEQNVIKLIESAFEGLKNLKLDFQGSQLGKPAPLTHAGELLFTFFPYTLSGHKDGKTLSHRSFYIAISYDQGKEWYIVDGIQVSASNITALLPEYAGQPPIPSTERLFSEDS